MTRCKADGIMKEKNEETDENIWFAKELVPELMEVEKKPPPRWRRRRDDGMKRHGWRRQWREGCGNDETTSADFKDGIISNIIYISSHFYSICIEL